jgi:histidinol phosphatase-like PHP family hydrolase
MQPSLPRAKTTTSQSRSTPDRNAKTHRAIAQTGRRYRLQVLIDTDAHAPGQLEWQYIGCDRAAECGVTEDRVINTGSAAMLLSWSA